MSIALAVSLLRTDGGTQPRAVLDDALIDEYAEAMRAGAEFPPAVAYYDGANLAQRRTLLNTTRQRPWDRWQDKTHSPLRNSRLSIQIDKPNSLLGFVPDKGGEPQQSQEQPT
jgi:hypothetical protein